MELDQLTKLIIELKPETCKIIKKLFVIDIANLILSFQDLPYVPDRHSLRILTGYGFAF